MHLAYFGTFLFFRHISRRSARYAEPGKCLRHMTHCTETLSSAGFVEAIVARPPLTNRPAAPAAPLLHSALLYSTLGLRSVGSGDRQRLLLPVLFHHNIQ